MGYIRGMARPSPHLVRALRDTSARLRSGSSFAWGHMGRCNCGHLAQTVTSLSPGEIHRRALARAGDWRRQALEYCPSSGLEFDHVIESMLALGLSRGDLRDLEELSGRAVLAHLRAGGHAAPLRRERREDAVRYMDAWAELLERQLPSAAPPSGPTAGGAAARAPAPGLTREPELAPA